MRSSGEEEEEEVVVVVVVEDERVRIIVRYWKEGRLEENHEMG